MSGTIGSSQTVDDASSLDPEKAVSGRDDYLSSETTQPYLLRLGGTLVFVSVTTISAFLILLPLAACIIAFRLVDVFWWLSGSDNDQRKLERRTFEEYACGWCLDAVVYGIMMICHWTGVWHMHVLGRRPTGVVRKVEWEEWSAKRVRVRNSDKIRVCPLPLDPKSLQTRIPGGCVIVSNHLSNIDGFCCKAALFPIVSKAMIKGAAFKFPGVGQILYYSGQCFVWGDSSQERAKNRDAFMKRCIEIIEHEVPLVIYPEGTRRAFGGMAPLRLGMIKFAIDNEYPILISVIHGSHISWPRRKVMVNIHPIYMKFSEFVICPKKGDSPTEVAEAILDCMLDLFEGIPGYDKEKEKPIKSMEEYKRLLAVGI